VSITRLPATCWVLPADLTAHAIHRHPLPHYLTRDSALTELATRAASTTGGAPLMLPAPCHQVACDDCGEIAADTDGEQFIHFRTVAAARAYLDSWHWTADAPIRCRWCHARRTDWTTTLIITAPR